MPRKSAKVPKFKSGTEEADWFATPEGRRHTEREFLRAVRAESVSRSSGLTVAKTDPQALQQLMEQARKKATRAISIRIPIADLERAEQIAGKTGVGYQTVLKRAIREGLNCATGFSL